MSVFNLFLIIINFILVFYILKSIKTKTIENNIKREIHSMLSEFSRISNKYIELIEDRVSQAKQTINKLENLQNNNNHNNNLKVIKPKENEQHNSERVFIKYEKIMNLYNNGKKFNQIADETGYTLAEIKTIINLYKNYPGSINKVR